MVAVLIGISLYSLASKLSTDHLRGSLYGSLLPLLILSILALIKFLLLKTVDAVYWILLTLCLIAQQILLVLKLDKNEDLNWRQVFGPSILIGCISILYALGFLMRALYDCELKKLVSGVLYLLSAGSFVLVVLMASGQYDERLLTVVYGSLGVFTVAFASYLGETVMDVAVGHIEPEVIEFYYPPGPPSPRTPVI